MVLKRITLIFFVCFLAICKIQICAAQEDYNSKYFGEENNMLNSPVSFILEDSDGRIWFQSEEKLSWFDGEHKKRIIHKSQNTFFNRAKLISNDLGGGILTSTKKTVEKYNKDLNSFLTIYKSNANFISDGFIDAVQFTETEFFILSRTQELYKVNDQEPSLMNVGFVANSIYKVDSIHLLMQNSEMFALYNIAEDSIKYKVSATGFPIIINNKIYIINKNVLYTYNTEKLEQTYTIDNEIDDIAIGKTGTIYIASENTIYSKGSELLPIISISKKIKSFIVDRENNFWIADIDGGVHFLFKNKIKNAIKLFYNADTKKEKMLTDGEGMFSYSFANKQIHNVITQEKIRLNEIPLAIYSKENGIAFRTANALYYRKGQNKKTTSIYLPDSIAVINCFFVKGRIYIIDDKHRIFNVNSNEINLFDSILQKYSIENILNIQVLNNKIFIATNEGIFYLTLQENATKVQKSDTIENHVSSIKKKDNAIYASVDSRIYKIDNEIEQLIFESNNKKIVDFSIKDGVLYVLTNQDLEINNLKDKSTTIYNFHDGFTNKFHSVSSKIVLKDTSLYISKYNVIYQLNLNHIENRPFNSQALFASIKVEGKNVTSNHFLKEGNSRTMFLNYMESDLTIHFTSNYYTDPSNLLYSYRMIGLNDNWIYTEGTNKSVSYFNLKGGEYTFQVRVHTDIMEEPSAISSINITIESPFWESRWFYLGTIIIFLVFIVFIYNARVTKIVRMRNMLEKQVEVRTKKLTEKSEELKNQKFKMQEQRDIANKLKAELSIEKLELEELRDKLTHVIDTRDSDNTFLSKTLDRTQKELKQLEREYELISENTRELIFSMTLPDETFDFVSPSALDVTGYYPYEFQERPTLLKSIVHKDDLVLFLEARNKMFSGEMPEKVEYRIVSKLGETKWIVQRNFLEENSEGVPVRLKSVLTDVTLEKIFEQKDTSAKKRTLVAEYLKQNIEESEKGDEDKVSHVIGEIADLLLESDIVFDEKQLYVDDPSINNDIPLQIIDDIIDLARVEAGQLILTKSNCYINSILKELHSSFERIKGKIGKQAVELSLKLASDKENFSIYTDTYRVRQVLLNLVGNAFKYTNKGLIEFGYEIEASSDDVDEELQNILFYVKDTGVGMEQSKIDQIFGESNMKFEKGDNKVISGVGLTISKVIAELLGGRMWVDSVKNVGTAFYFTLPLKKHKGLKQEAKVGKVGKKLDWKGKCILVAEDEENNFRFIKAALKKSGVELIHALDGLEALRIFKEKNKTIDVVLMDIQMPNMNGYDAARAFIEVNPDVPIIAQTAFAMSGGKIKCFEAGCAGYIAKPYKAKDLIEAIDKHLSGT